MDTEDFTAVVDAMDRLGRRVVLFSFIAGPAAYNGGHLEAQGMMHPIRQQGAR
jgi:hypothetical protein